MSSKHSSYKNISARVRARQQRAYERFTLDKRKASDTAYMKRKEAELRSLQRSLGLAIDHAVDTFDYTDVDQATA